MLFRTMLSTAIAIAFASTAIADNWPHWRGDGNGVAANATPPTEWSATKNVKWKVAIPGQGSGSPVVWEDRVYVVSGVPAGAEKGAAGPIGSTGPIGPQQDRRRRRRGRGNAAPLRSLEFTLFCFDRETGKQLWMQVAVVAKPHQATHSTNNFASASPCTDGKHVYAHFGSRGVFCYTMDGKSVWKRENLGKMETRNAFGEGSSPTLADEKLLIPWDHEGPSALFALNKLTGKTIWKTERDEPTCWATPLVVKHEGKKQVVLNGQTCARGYDLDSGKELWRCSGQTDRPAASAVAGGGLIFVGSGYRGSYLGAFRPGGRGNLAGTKNVAWSINRDTPDVASPLLTSGRLYFYKAKTGILTCVDAATGEPHYQSVRVPGISSTYASPIAAGGLVFLTGRSGRTVVIKDSDKFKVVASNSVGETVDATPAPVGNQLFIRGAKHLFCIAKP